MSSSSIITPEDVLKSLMNDGTIDAIRLKIINQLKANEDLKKTAITMVEESKVLNNPGAEKQTKRELFDALRHELEIPVLEKASKSAWELILDNNGLGKEISETVERVFCRLSGREPPLFPDPNIGTLPDTETDKQTQTRKGKEKKNGTVDENKKQKKTKKDQINTPLKKRSFTLMSMEGGDDDVPPAIQETS